MTSTPAPARPRRAWERTDRQTGERYLSVAVRGAALLEDPILNKGTCFTLDERDDLGLRGLLPPAVSTPADQARRSYENYLEAPDDIRRYLFLAALQDRNETLFYRLLIEHLEEMVPIVYTPTVGEVCARYSHLYRRPRGIYVSTADRGRMAALFRNADRGAARVIVVTDNEAILGIGDQGVGGMGISIGKLALYTAAAGLHPARGLPVTIDVGTDNQALLDDPLYLGVRHRRLRGDDYFEILDELVAALATEFPEALVQWEDFANQRAFQVLGRYRRQLPSFDDDIQGTGAVVEAGIQTAMARLGRHLAGERIVFFGAGASGAGCALQMADALRRAGVSADEAARRVLCLDSRGLILRDRPGLESPKADVAADPAVVGGWRSASPGGFGLADVVREFKPTMLVGASGQPGAFSEHIVREMHAGCERPVIFALSNPTSKAEATPADLLRWTNGAALVATGSPFAPVALGGITHVIGQCNNAFVFPGVGLGATVVGARWLPDHAFAAAARAVAAATPAGGPGAALYPPISELRRVARDVAVAVASTLVAEAAAPPLSLEAIERRVDESIWEPVYRRYRAARTGD